MLEDLIKQKRDSTELYEKFLTQAEALVKKMATKHMGNYPHVLHGYPEAVVLYNNLDSIPAAGFKAPANEEEKAKLALDIDLAMREHAPAGWKGDDTREKQVLNALFPIMSLDRTATQAIFDIIKKQPGY